MSLVSDALRRARQEAATRDAVRGGGPPPARVLPPQPRRVGFIVVATVVAVVALGGAAAAWWLLARTGDDGLLPTATQPAQPAVAASESAPVPSVESPAVPTAAPVQAEAERAAAVPSAAPGEPAAGAAHAPQPAQALPVETVSSASAPSESAAEHEPSGGPHPAREHATGPREFVEHADLGYATLELGYIAYLPSDPFAQINGRDVRVGAVVDGFVVKDIAADAVTLHDGHGDVVLRVR